MRGISDVRGNSCLFQERISLHLCDFKENYVYIYISTIVASRRKTRELTLLIIKSDYCIYNSRTVTDTNTCRSKISIRYENIRNTPRIVCVFSEDKMRETTKLHSEFISEIPFPDLIIHDSEYREKPHRVEFSESYENKRPKLRISRNSYTAYREKCWIRSR